MMSVGLIPKLLMKAGTQYSNNRILMLDRILLSYFIDTVGRYIFNLSATLADNIFLSFLWPLVMRLMEDDSELCDKVSDGYK